MADIVITEPMDEEGVALLTGEFDVVYESDLPDRMSDLLRLISDCRGLIVRNRTQVRATLLEAAPKLRVVGRLGVGLDNIDLDACKARGVRVIPAIGANEPTVAEYVVGAIILLLRQGLFHRTDDILAGKWPRMATKGRDAMGKQLGLIGFGNIGREVAKRAIALGMNVAAYDPNVPRDDEIWERSAVQPCDLPALLAESDVVSIHTPLTSDTRNLIDAAALARMKSDAVLINTARGGIVEESALVEALCAGRLGGAMLDVFDQEPVPTGNAWAGVPNLYLTAHDAGYSAEAYWRQGDIVADGVRSVLKGSPKA